METPDTYRQPAETARAELRVKGSRFLAEVLCVADSAQAAEALAATRRRYHDATHHCSAWRVGATGDEYRSDDDGEPSGSAGLPILRQLDGAGLTNTLVVVVRWYGGTKLGTGGLVRAYGDAAREALAVTPVRERIRRARFRVMFGFEDTSPAMHTLSRFDARVVDTRYGEGTEIDVDVRLSQADAFETEWVDALRGRGAVARLTA